MEAEVGEIVDVTSEGLMGHGIESSPDGILRGKGRP